MFAIAFDMVVSDLKKNYGEPYNNAYFAIGVILRKYGFYNARGSVVNKQERAGDETWPFLSEKNPIDKSAVNRYNARSRCRGSSQAFP